MQKQRLPDLEITNTTKGKLPSLPFRAVKESVAGKRFRVSLVIANDKISRELNRRYRGRNKPANVLSFCLSNNSGEIFLNTGLARREASDFNLAPDKFITFLFIHALLHLKGFTHGSKMEAKERRFRARFDI